MSFIINTAAEVTFVLVNATDGSPIMGLTPAGFRSIDAGAQAAVAGAIVEQGNGEYRLSATAADLNGTTIGFTFTGVGAVPAHVLVATVPAEPPSAVQIRTEMEGAGSVLDGVNDLNSVQQVVTVNGIGTTDTVINVNETITGVLSDITVVKILTGANANETRGIASNTANQLTLQTAFSAVPGGGTALKIL